MRKEWNIETVDITPAAPQKQEGGLPVTKMGRIRHFLKKNPYNQDQKNNQGRS